MAAELSYNDAWYTFGGGLARKNVTAKSYTPFGELLTEQTSGFGYNGEYYNAATGMIYLRARFYEPEMNRFSQKDILRGSITDGNSLNRYLYCQNDPVNFADYNGLQMVNVCVADGGGSGRRVTPNQTTSIVTKPGQNSVSSASAASRTVAVPMTDTGTGGYSSAYSAAGAVTGYGNGQGNQGTQTGTSQTSGITRDSPSVQDVTGSGQYSCGRDIRSLGAGDYGYSTRGQDDWRLVGFGLQVDASIAVFDVGAEMVVYTDKNVIDHTYPEAEFVIAGYVYYGAGVSFDLMSQEAIVNTVFSNQTLLNYLSEIRQNPTSPLSVSGSAFAVYGNEQFSSPDDYTGPFDTFSVTAGHIKGYYSTSPSAKSVGGGRLPKWFSLWTYRVEFRF